MENFIAEICQKHCFFNDEPEDRWTEGRTERPTNGRTRHHHHWAVSTVMASVPNWKQSESCGELKWKRLEKTHSSNGINYKSLSLNRMKITKTEKKKKKPLAWLFVSHHCPSHHHRRRHYQQVCHNLDLNSNSEICSSWLSGKWNYYLERGGEEWGKIIWLC